MISIRNIFLNLSLSLGGVVFGILICEVIATCLYPAPTTHKLFSPFVNTTFLPDPQTMPGITGASRFMINSSGLRADELSYRHNYKILTVGGSTTECLYLDQKEAWPYLLQEKLDRRQNKYHVWVGNAGKSGLNTRDHIFLLKYLLDELPRPDMIIVLAGVNDFLMRLYLDKEYDPDFLKNSGQEEYFLPRVFAEAPNNKAVPFYKKTGLWRLFQRLKAHPDGPVQDVAGQYYKNARQRRTKCPEVNALPDLTASLNEYAQNVRSLIEMSRKKSIPIVFLTQPVMWGENLPEALEKLIWMGDAAHGTFHYSSAALAAGMRQYDETLLRVCREEKVECLDLAAEMPRDSSVLYDDVHFNEHGADVFSDKLTDLILRRLRL